MPCRAVAIELLRRAVIAATQALDQGKQYRAGQRVNQLLSSLNIPQIEALEDLVDLLASSQEEAR